LGRFIRRRWEFAKGFVSELIEIVSAALRVLCHGLPVLARERVFALAERPILVPARAAAILIPAGRMRPGGRRFSGCETGESGGGDHPMGMTWRA
jgi:hypothetical protein